jgi:hypothetical protein
MMMITNRSEEANPFRWSFSSSPNPVTFQVIPTRDRPSSMDYVTIPVQINPFSSISTASASALVGGGNFQSTATASSASASSSIAYPTTSTANHTSENTMN